MTWLMLSYLQSGKECSGQHLWELRREQVRHGRKESKLQLRLADVHCSEHSAWKGLGSADPFHVPPSLPGTGDPLLAHSYIQADLLCCHISTSECCLRKMCLSAAKWVWVYFASRISTHTA